ncbi:unnamed protein product [Amoebophrya sp. A25]|nr:unnamed protein product [Amoebophrya sp. A25]|eukprot:GSA25T00006691001.1
MIKPRRYFAKEAEPLRAQRRPREEYTSPPPLRSESKKARLDAQEKQPASPAGKENKSPLINAPEKVNAKSEPQADTGADMSSSEGISKKMDLQEALEWWEKKRLVPTKNEAERSDLSDKKKEEEDLFADLIQKAKK